MLKRNWEFRFGKFASCVPSWSSRNLPSLSSRIEVLRTFALSRVFYVASILPIKKTMVKRFESIIGKFIWNSGGWLLRVALEDIKNPRNKGGLNLVCLQSMSNSLLLSQLFRLLRSSDDRSKAHIGFWIGYLLTDFLPGIDSGPSSNVVPDYYADIEFLIIEGQIDDLVTVNEWKLLTNKIIYRRMMENIDPPRIEIEAGISFKNVWQNISQPVLSSSAADISFLLVHNKLPVGERLFRVGVKIDPYCDFCPGAQFCDIEHFFCSCSRVDTVWSWVKDKVLILVGETVENSDLVRYILPACSAMKEVVWLWGIYFEKTWKDLHLHGYERLNADEFFGYLKFKYKADQLGARHSLEYIPGLL